MTEDEDGGGIDLGDAVTGVGEEDSTSSSTSRGDDEEPRTHVHAKVEYGTEGFPPGTECEKCSNLAEGVLIGRTPLQVKDEGLVKAVPICKRHRRELEIQPRYQLDNYVYETF